MVGPREENELLERAATGVFSTIRQDRERIPEKMKSLFSYLEDHLFDKNLTAGQWFRACGLRSHSYNDRFRNEIGANPHAYFTQLRLETAKNLLKNTDLEIWRLSELLGYPLMETFHKAFKRSCGLSPSSFRNRYRQSENRKLHRHLQELNRIRPWRKFIAGAPECPLALTGELLTQYPYLRHRLEAAERSRRVLAVDRRLFERRKAQRIWEKLRGRDFSEQCLIIHLQISFETTALFDLLREQSLTEGREDRQRGVHVAMLALASLKNLEARGEDLPNRLAEGWACLANAFYLANDIPSAEKTLTRAELELELAAEHRDPLVEAEIFLKKSRFRWYQRRHEEALELVDRAIRGYRTADEHVSLAQALILKGGIRRDAGDPKAAIADFREALDLISSENQPYLCLSAQTGLACAYRLLGDYEETEKALAEGDVLCEVLDFDVGRHQCRWIAGLVKQERGDLEVAERYLEEARSGLVEVGEMGYASMVILDLAILHAEEGRSAKVMKAALEALPLLEALQLRGETVAAVSLLRDAVEEDKLNLPVLRKVRETLADTDPELHALGAT